MYQSNLFDPEQILYVFYDQPNLVPDCLEFA